MESDWRPVGLSSRRMSQLDDEKRPLLADSASKTLWRALSQDSAYFAGVTSKFMDPENRKSDSYAQVTKQSSIVTIFAVWNTMMGTSLLAMPWGIERAGFAMGPALTLGMGGLCLYTAYCNIRAQRSHGGPTGDIAELTRTLLGPHFEMVAKVFSLIVLLGANIVYWILMSNFLYHSVNYIVGITEDTAYDTTGNMSYFPAAVFCPNDAALAGNSSLVSNTYKAIWNIDVTVPVFLALLIGPLLNFKSPTFFTKFNSLGTLSVMYLIVFVIVKSSIWGVNLDVTHTESLHYSPLVKDSFPATAGMLALSFFIHNIIITVMRSNANQKNNGRDLSIAYFLVTATYMTIGVVFYVTFPLAKSCIQDNILNNFASWDVMTVVARVFLLFQLVTVFPLISYMLRVQTMIALTGEPYPSRSHVITFNFIIVAVCILFAVFLPRIGTIIRFTGAISGLIHVFALPCILRLATLYREDRASATSWILHSAIAIYGGAVLLGQFFVSDTN
ncbi:Transmembrane amino acid transporter protein [Nesidiocoris tenuis]|uniref:Transmembrane amino acid transporter protein n=1 Tax=Nesidiocoris tenuis TaxID=355587 RepID=A0ABN7B2K2_9HEMI|nr:Transmembrane amino acid transporter protein [Nesidiocoris tenuis]